MCATIYGYPLMEFYRSCVLQTRFKGPVCRRLNSLAHHLFPSDPWHHDAPEPTTDLLRSDAWIDLSGGPVALGVPASSSDPQRYFVLALHDPYGENFANLGPANCDPAGETLWLQGPSRRGSLQQPPEARVLRCPANLLNLQARVQVGQSPDFEAARAMQAQITLGAPPARAGSPGTLARWAGPPIDVLQQLQGPSAELVQIAPAFYTNLSHALAEAPGREEDQGLVAWLAGAGLDLGQGFDWDALDIPTQTGLVQGLEDAIQLLCGMSRYNSRPLGCWTFNPTVGRYGNDYLARAQAARQNLGALNANELVSASCHASTDGADLHGRQRYLLRFDSGRWPPTRSHWSISLYGADRIPHANALERYAIGARSNDLRSEADGSLVIEVSHRRPARLSNWLPAPDGPFHLVLRIYRPCETLGQWQPPAMLRADACGSVEGPRQPTRGGA